MAEFPPSAEFSHGAHGGPALGPISPLERFTRSASQGLMGCLGEMMGELARSVREIGEQIGWGRLGISGPPITGPVRGFGEPRRMEAHPALPTESTGRRARRSRKRRIEDETSFPPRPRENESPPSVRSHMRVPEDVHSCWVQCPAAVGVRLTGAARTSTRQPRPNVVTAVAISAGDSSRPDSWRSDLHTLIGVQHGWTCFLAGHSAVSNVWLQGMWEKRCPGFIDRSRCCYNCSEAEYRTENSHRPANCPPYEERGLPAGHRPRGSGVGRVRRVKRDWLARDSRSPFKFRSARRPSERSDAEATNILWSHAAPTSGCGVGRFANRQPAGKARLQTGTPSGDSTPRGSPGDSPAPERPPRWPSRPVGISAKVFGLGPRGRKGEG